MDGWVEFETATKLTGSRFSVLKGPLARLQRALTPVHVGYPYVKNGYTEAYVPYLSMQIVYVVQVNYLNLKKIYSNMQGEKEYYLIPTAEVPVTNFVRDFI